MNETIPLNGNVKDMIVPWLFLALNAAKRNGTVVFENDDVVKKVYFSAGDIISASSSQSEDRLGEWLVRTGVITRQQCDSVSELFKQTGEKEGKILVDQGIITQAALMEGVKSHVKQIIVSILNWRDGSYVFEENVLPASDIIPLQISTGNLIIEGLREIDWKVIRKSLPPLRTIVRPTENPSHLFQGADLERDHWDVFSLLDGTKSMEEICGISGIGDFNTLKAIYVLLALRMAEAGELKTEEEKKFAKEVVQEAVPPKEEKRAPARVITREELKTVYATLEQQNYYELLNVSRGATGPEIKKAYFGLAKLYHPDRHFQPEMSDMKEILEALFGAVHDAYETLSNQVKRDQYDLALDKPAAKSRVEEKAKPGPADSKDNADAQYQEGINRFKAGNFWGAEEAFRWAMRLDPDNAEYVFRRAQTLSRIPRRGHEAEENFVKAVKMSPKKIEYYLQLGGFYEKIGLKSKALAVYNDALKIEPTSEKIKEAVTKISG